MVKIQSDGMEAHSATDSAQLPSSIFSDCDSITITTQTSSMKLVCREVLMGSTGRCLFRVGDSWEWLSSQFWEMSRALVIVHGVTV